MNKESQHLYLRDTPNFRLCIPNGPLRLKLLKEHHDCVKAGHPGRDRTFGQLVSFTGQKWVVIRRSSGVEFSFNDVMFRQIDGVAMGSPLGPVLANIFVGYCESLIPSSSYPPLYCRFMDDSFAYFSSVSQCDEFC